MKLTITTDDGEILEQIRIVPILAEDDVKVAKEIIEQVEMIWETEEL